MSQREMVPPKITIQISGEVGIGKSHVMATIMKALRDTYGPKGCRLAYATELKRELEIVDKGYGYEPRPGTFLEITELTPRELEKQKQS